MAMSQLISKFSTSYSILFSSVYVMFAAESDRSWHSFYNNASSSIIHLLTAHCSPIAHRPIVMPGCLLSKTLTLLPQRLASPRLASPQRLNRYDALLGACCSPLLSYQALRTYSCLCLPAYYLPAYYLPAYYLPACLPTMPHTPHTPTHHVHTHVERVTKGSSLKDVHCTCRQRLGHGIFFPTMPGFGSNGTLDVTFLDGKRVQRVDNHVRQGRQDST
jgi:hypothetical protein